MNTKKFLYASFLLLLGLTMTGSAQSPLFEKLVFSGQDSLSLPYRLLKPVHYDTKDTSTLKQHYPLVIFLHGSGERGDDNEIQLKNGALNFADSLLRENHPAFMIVPQCQLNRRWAEVDWSADHHLMQEIPSTPMQALIALIDQFIHQFPVDTNRIYITGLSMGGYGTWDLISRFPSKFAAALPVCGGGDELQAEKLIAIPIWDFHGAKDPVVNVNRSRNMIAAIKKAGGRPLYTEVEDAGHDVWWKVYSDKIVLEWLFTQTKTKPVKPEDLNTQKGPGK